MIPLAVLIRYVSVTDWPTDGHRPTAWTASRGKNLTVFATAIVSHVGCAATPPPSPPPAGTGNATAGNISINRPVSGRRDMRRNMRHGRWEARPATVAREWHYLMQTKSIPAGVRASFPFSVSLSGDYAIDHHAPTSYRSVARGIFIFKELLYMVLVVFVVSKWRIYNRNFGRERTGFYRRRNVNVIPRTFNWRFQNYAIMRPHNLPNSP